LRRVRALLLVVGAVAVAAGAVPPTTCTHKPIDNRGSSSVPFILGAGGGTLVGEGCSRAWGRRGGTPRGGRALPGLLGQRSPAHRQDGSLRLALG
jgi:hypothetical protein